MKEVFKKYKIVRKLSEGNFGIVYMVQLISKPSQIYALKELIPTSKRVETIRKEIDIMSRLNH